MHMIQVAADLQKRDLVAQRDLQAHFLQDRIDLRIKHHAPVLGWAHQMIQKHTHIVALVEVTRHDTQS
jgi:hypothetical protein